MQKANSYILFLLLPFFFLNGQTKPDFKSSFLIINPPEGEDPGNNLRISKRKLVQVVDSLLGLDVIDQKEIELVAYYNDLLNSYPDSSRAYTVRLSDLNFYEDLDESVIFPLVSDKEIADLTTLLIENDALSYYTSPRAGVVTSLYGWRDKKMHKGIDIDLVKGDAVVAAFDGKVRIAAKKRRVRKCGCNYAP